ncbi:unnamed protein product [Urochloa decumbens]|uniref:Uncharacterized protein n=1 Tax=Urochloa decumbens TaxID=240449 RepID=A0ABC8ZFL0_9POAL
MDAHNMMRYPPRRANDDDNLLPARMGMGGRRALAQPQLLDSAGCAFMLLATIVFTWHQLAGCDPEYVLAAFVLWLLGAALAMLSVVSRQFPRLAAAGEALARALRNYLLGGL